MRTKHRWSPLASGLMLTLFTFTLVPDRGWTALAEPPPALDVARSVGEVLVLPPGDPGRRASGLGPLIEISALDNQQYFPNSAYNPLHREYLVVWHNAWSLGTRDIHGQRVSETGELVGAPFVIFDDVTRDSAQPSIAYDIVGDRYLVVWSYDVSGNGSDWDIYGRFVPSTGPTPALGAFAIATTVESEWLPLVVKNEHPSWQEFLVVWTTTPTGGPSFIGGQRVLADGSGVALPCCLELAKHASAPRAHPDASYNLARNEYLLVYDDTTDVLAKRLQANGTPIGGGTAEFAIAGWPDAETHPAVAACSAADQYLVAWHSQRASTDIFARYVTGAGVTQEVFLIDATTSREENADVACDAAGRDYLLAWDTQYTSGLFGVWARRAGTDKTLHDAFFMAYPCGVDRCQPSITAGSYGFLTVWEDERDAVAYQDIMGIVQGGPIFRDDFESGTWSAWSKAVL